MDTILDTELSPKLSTDKLNTTEDKITFLLIDTTIDNGEFTDPSISIIEDTEENRQYIKDNNINVIGAGTTKKSIAELTYGINHPTRLLYRSAVTNLMGEFTEDDKVLRSALNKIN
jgi:hypothetical protein